MSDQPNDPTAQQWSQPQAAPVPDYLIWSILATLFCCQPLGIAAIVYAAMANSKKSSDIAGAYTDAAMSKKLLWWSFGLGIGVWIAFGVFYAGVIGLSIAGGSV